MRTATIARKTSETDIALTVNLDGTGRHDIATGVGFYDHMLAQLARHGHLDLDILTRGDLHIDAHHTVEDTALALGEAVSKALGDRAGIARFGHAYAPMDETLTRVALDISGRPYLVWKVAFSQPRLGTLDTELIGHVFHSFAQAAGITLHVETLYGHNNHHIAESAFKALGRALAMAVALDPRAGGSIPSTKGSLGGSPAGPAA
jgi:imidazoleglycerol-phosphate dehydratase